MHTVDHFIKKFEAIPEYMWTTCALGHEGGPRCALGHTLDGMNNTEETSSLVGVIGGVVVRINNGDDKRYQQSTPKQRVLAALHDIKALEVPKYRDITSELAILPVDEMSDQPVQVLA